MAHSVRFLTLTAPILFLTMACGDDITALDPQDAGFEDAGVSLDATPPDVGPADTGVVPDSGFDAGVDGPQSIIFLHTNDEHSHLLGFAPNVDDYPARSMSESIKGGIYRRSVVLDRLRTEASFPGLESPVVTVSSGDIHMGSLFHLGNLANAAPEFVVQGVLRYDAMSLGTHEFDFGPFFLSNMIASGNLDPINLTFSPLEIPLVASNLRFSMTSNLDDRLESFYGGRAGRPIQRTHVRRFGDVTVGFVGVMGLNAASLAPTKSPVVFSLAVDEDTTCDNDSECPSSICIPPSDAPTGVVGSCALDPTGFNHEVNFPALVADIADAVRDLRVEGVDIVVALSQAGIDEREVNSLLAMDMGLENATRSEEILLARGVDEALATVGLRGLDLIVGGHSQTALEAPLVVPNENSGSNTYIVQAGSYGRFVGRVRLTRESRQTPWTLDDAYSGLEPIDGTVDTSGLSPITALILDNLFDTLIDNLESAPLALAEDGLILPGEQCDLDLDGSLVPFDACAEVFGNTTGPAACHPNRQWDLSGCVLEGGTTCGDGNIAIPEQCESGQVPSCTDLGYEGGNTACLANCTIDVSGCTVRYPSLLEAALNFALPPGTDPILFGPNNNRGDLFFNTVGTASFDVGEIQETNESNVANLVADANRQMSNLLLPEFQTDPIRVSFAANGMIRDGIYQGQTGVLTAADLFRVLPLGLSPQENTPGHALIDFWLNAAELKAAFEIGLTQGFANDTFWLSMSGAQIDYDLSRPPFDPDNPTTTGQVTRIRLIETGTASEPWADINATYEATDLFNIDTGGFDDPDRLVHVSTNFYIGLFITEFGLCPRIDGVDGEPFPQCKSCVDNTECPAAGTRCDVAAGTCTGGSPIPFFTRTTVPFALGLRQELKEFLALLAYVRRLPDGGALPVEYSQPTPRRMCCVGASCPADGSRTCP